MKSNPAFFKSADDPDYLLRGAWKNYQTGIFRWTSTIMQMCWTDNIQRYVGLTPSLTSVKLNRIDIVKYRRVITTHNLSTVLFTAEVVSADWLRWTADTSRWFGSFDAGTYDIEIEDNQGNYFISNPFYIDQEAGVLVPVITVGTRAPGDAVDEYAYQLRLVDWVLQQKFDWEESWRTVGDFTGLPRLTTVTVTEGHTLNFYNELGLLRSYDASTLERLVSVTVDGTVVTFTDQDGGTTVINIGSGGSGAQKARIYAQYGMI